MNETERFARLLRAYSTVGIVIAAPLCIASLLVHDYVFMIIMVIALVSYVRVYTYQYDMDCT